MISRILILFCIGVLNLGILPCETESSSTHSSSSSESSSDSKTGSTSDTPSKIESESETLISGFILKNLFVTFRSHEHNATDYPKGPNITGIPETLSNLTDAGKDHAYKFGQYLRAHYSASFNITNLTASDFYCKGTSTRRTQESAIFVAAGLVGNETGTTQWTEEKGKEYLFNKTELYIKFYNMTECPAFYKAVAENVKTGTFNNSVKDYMTAVNNVSKIYPNVTHDNPATVWLAYETLWSKKYSENKSLGNITDDDMQNLRKYAEQFIYYAESTNKSKKISGGVMVDGLLSKFEITNETEKQKMENSMRKMSLLAAPQGVLGAMIGAFSPPGTRYNGANFTAETFYPGNGSYHILEYYENKTDNKGKHFRVLYTPNWTVPLMPLIYPGCNETSGMCTQERLQEVLKDIRLKPEEQDKTCKGERSWIDTIKDALVTVIEKLFKSFSLFGQKTKSD